jgi:UDP-glucose 4-epimerase
VPVDETSERVLGAAGDMRTSYAASKSLEESLALAWAYERGLPVVVARLFNTAGPRQRSQHGMVLPRFVQRALTGRALRILGDGGQSRCFAHVLDVVEALQRLVESPSATCDVFNVGRPEEVTVLELAERVMKATGTTVPIELIPYPYGFREPRRRVPDVTKIRERTGWTATHDLDSIIQDIVAEHAPRQPAAAVL